MRTFITLLSVIFFCQYSALSQCTNTLKFPQDNFQVLPFSGDQMIVNNQFAGDYCIVENLVVGKPYLLSSSNALDYFTIRDADGLVLFDHGNTPLSFTPTEANLSFHINLASPNCGTEFISRITTIACTDCEDEPSKIGVSTSEPEAILDINGEIKLGSSISIPKAGMIRWNPENKDFEGYDGTDWVSFTKSDAKTWGQTSSTEGTENYSTTASNGSSNDKFGSSISIMGNYAVVGSPFRNINANANQGAAYVFVYTNDEWVEQQMIFANDGHANAEFGYDVAISGNFIIVGVRKANVNGNVSQGAAYIFHREGESWTQQAKIFETNGSNGDNFGSSVAISSDEAIIGAPYENTSPHFDNGAVYIFNRTGNTWTQSQKLLANDITTDATFGIDIDLSNNYIIIGSYPGEFSGNYGYGSAYIFHKAVSTWAQQDKITPSDPQFEDLFGISVAIDGTHAVVGAYNNNPNGNLGQGAAYVFQRQGTTWDQLSKLFLNDGSADDNFGLSLDISDNELIVGAPYFNSGGLTSNGIAIVYRKQGDIWTEISKINASDATSMDNFGTTLGIHLNQLIIGAPNKEVATNPDQGKVYFVKKN